MSARLVLLSSGVFLAGACIAASAQVQAQARPPAATAAAAAAVRPAAASDAAAIDASFKAWDTDHNGVLSEAEFRPGIEALRRRARAAAELAVRLREQFDKVDANRNDGIDAGEYGNLVLVRDAGKAAPALSAFDRNGNQRLEFTEYVALVARMAPAPRAAGKSP